jgi:hypothetical protein
MFKQHDQNLQRLFGETYREATVVMQFAGANVKGKAGKERQLFGLVRTWQDSLLTVDSSINRPGRCFTDWL